MPEDPKQPDPQDPEDPQEPAEDPKEPGDEWEPPSREEWERTTKRLAEVNDEAKKHRLKAREQAQKAEKAEHDGDETAAAAAQKERDAWKPRVVKSAARAALLEAEAKPDRINRLLAMVDVDDCDVDDSGDVQGLADQIAEIKRDMPELFGSKRRGRGDSGDKGDQGAGQPKTVSEAQADYILHGSRS